MDRFSNTRNLGDKGDYVINWTRLQASSSKLNRRLEVHKPSVAFVLGSGLSLDIPELQIHEVISYEDIDAIGATTIPGHPGQLCLAEYRGIKILLWRGRRHVYELESNDLTPIAAPAFLTRELGANILILTNSSGGLTKKAGTFVVISDHVNRTGLSLLRGPHNFGWGERFPDQTTVYDPDLQTQLLDAVAAAGGEVTRGVFVGVLGPEYETPAEVIAFRSSVGDIIAMSTALEATFANAGGLRVGGLSVVANEAAGLSGQPLKHDDIAAAAKRAAPVFCAAIPLLLDRLYPAL